MCWALVDFSVPLEKIGLIGALSAEVEIDRLGAGTSVQMSFDLVPVVQRREVAVS